MTSKIHIIHPEQGNISSIRNAFEMLGASVEIVSERSQLENAEKLVLPGIGHFDTAMKKLTASGLDKSIIEFATSGKPLLGICLGMQLLGKSSEEGTLKGLGLLNGSVIKMKAGDSFRFKIPHNGWNNLTEIVNSPLLNGISTEDYFFFLHGYKWKSETGKEVLASSDYETAFPAIIGNDAIFGVQFHPEKSHESGLKILRNFLNL